MLRGGPDVTLGLSPKTRSYSRMLMLAKETERFMTRLPLDFFPVRPPRWRDSWSVREDMALRRGALRNWEGAMTPLGDVGEVRTRTVGAELEMEWLRDTSKE